MQEKKSAVSSVHTDIAVAGGGVAGVCAAIAAARAGVTVALIQNRPVLGGNSSSEVRVWTRGASGGGTLYAEEMGVLGELKLKNLAYNPGSNPVLWDEVLLDSVYAEPNIRLFLNTQITGVSMEGASRIRSVRAAQLFTKAELEFTADMFVDSTGDGAVAALAGAKYRVGREGRSEFGESLAPAQGDSYVLGSSILMQYRHTGRPVAFRKPAYAYDIPYIRRLLSRGGRIADDTMNGGDYWWIEFGGTKDTIAQCGEITRELKALVLGIWNYIKNSGEFDAGDLELEWVGNVAGKRESRRFEGVYMLTQNALVKGELFGDSVCYGGWYMDFHPPEGIYSEQDFCEQIPVFAYNIPMRCLYSEQFGNLVFSGRIISVSHAAFASTRVQDTCGQVGQAAGEIAAYCCKNRVSPQTAHDEGIDAIQQSLLKNDMTLFGFRNTDAADLARTAEISCSGVRRAENRDAGGELAISDGTFVVCPKPDGVRRVEVLVKAAHAAVLSGRIFSCNLPSRFMDGAPAGSFSGEVPAGVSLFSVGLDDLPSSGYAKIEFAGCAGVSILTSSHSMTGFLAGNRSSPQYVNPCVLCDSPLSVYDCRQVVNGITRPYRGANLWIAPVADTPQWLSFFWDAPRKVSQIRLTFNPDLAKELPSIINTSDKPHHGFAKRNGMPAELVRSFAVFAGEGSGEVRLAAEDDNILRQAVVRFEPVVTRRIRVEFYRTYGGCPPEVFEVRIY